MQSYRIHDRLSSGIDGGIAQLGERLNGIQEVMGSNPTISIFQEVLQTQENPVFSTVCRTFILRFPIPGIASYNASFAAGNTDPLSIPHISLLPAATFAADSRLTGVLRDAILCLLSKKETRKRLFVSLYPHTNHRNRYPAITAVRVNGTEILIKALFGTSYPFFFKMPIPVILAEAPTGVIFPPSVAPVSRPK